jgi:hypothetical protein
LVCRETTERPESIDSSTFMVESPEKLNKIFYKHIKNFKINIESPYGDGYTSLKICNILKNIIMSNKVDVVICITSYNRYDNVKSLVNQILTQGSKYTYQMLLINDASKDDRYTNFNNYSEKLTYIHKSINGGKNGYYQTINKLWELIPHHEPEYVIQTDDDFILCDNFLDTLIDEFKNERGNNDKLYSLCPHLYSFNKVSNNEKFWTDTKSVDGIAIMTLDVLKNINYKLINPGNVNNPGVSVGIWQQISKSIKNLNGFSKRTLNSLVYHDNSGGSMMHGDFRKIKMIYTQNFIGKLPQSVIDFDKNYQQSNQLLQKKKLEDISSGNKATNNESNIKETQKPTQVIISTPISNKKPNIKKESVPEKMQKPKIINKTHDALFVGKSMKKKLRFGRK